jgi:hypothetical protein
MSIGATVIDHAEMDRAVLAEAAARRGDAAVVRSETLSRGVGSSGSRNSPTESVAVLRARATTAAELEAAELTGYLAKGKQAEADGKTAVARIFYDMVARRDKGQLKQQAQVRLAALAASAATAKR